jgi:hypothetical protein
MTQGLALPQTAAGDAGKQVGSDIVRAIEKAQENTLYTPWFWRFIMLAIIIHHARSRIFRKMSM